MSWHTKKRSALFGALALSLLAGPAVAFDLRNGVISEQEVLRAHKPEAALVGAYGNQRGPRIEALGESREPHGGGADERPVLNNIGETLP